MSSKCSVELKTDVHAAVTGGKKGVALGVPGLGHHADLESVGQRLPIDGLSDALIEGLLHSAISFPRRKYTVSSDTVFMAAKIRSGATSRTAAARSSGVSWFPVAA